MTSAHASRRVGAIGDSDAVDQRFEAIVFDWDDIAVTDPSAGLAGSAR